MHTRFAILAVSAVLCAFGAPALAATGFVDEPLWLSPEKPKEGQSATLTAVFRNAESETLSGTISFYDGTTLLAERAVTIFPDQVASSSVTFKIQAGRHEFSAAMTDAKEQGAGALAMAEATVSIPDVLVPKNFLAAKTESAQASGSGDSASQREILDQVDKAEQAVLGVLPEPVKETVSNAVGAVEDWRETKSERYADSRDAAKLDIERQKLDAAKVAKKTVSGKTEPAVSPLSRAKLLFFSAVALLFSPLFFYVIIALVAFLIVRFFVLKIVRALRGNRRRGPGRPKNPDLKQ